MSLELNYDEACFQTVTHGDEIETIEDLFDKAEKEEYATEWAKTAKDAGGYHYFTFDFEEAHEIADILEPEFPDVAQELRDLADGNIEDSE